jgi:glycosyltransferase involved in cell wall biosynthesis
MGIGGAEISLGHLVATISNDIQITIIGVSDRVVDAIAKQRPQASYHVLPAIGMRAWITHLLIFLRVKPDIIHLNLCTPWAGAIALTVALLLPQVRVVRVDQLPLRTTDAFTLWRTRSLCLRVDAHVAVGVASAYRMEDFYALGRDSVISIPNGVPDWGVLPSPNLTEGILTVASIGRLDAMKGHDLLLRSLAQLPGVRAIFLGDGNQRSALESLAAELGVSDRVEFRGWVEHPHVHLANVDVVVLPSRSEGFPLAMVEAMLAARPVIATRVGSMPEAIIDGETGLLIDKNDLAGLTQALCTLRDHPQQRSHLGQHARKKAIAHFTAEAMTAQYERLWYQVMKQARSPRFRIPRPKD